MCSIFWDNKLKLLHYRIEFNTQYITLFTVFILYTHLTRCPQKGHKAASLINGKTYNQREESPNFIEKMD